MIPTIEVPIGWVAATLGEVCELNPPKAKGNALPDDKPVTFVPMPAVDAELGAITAPAIRTFGEVRKGFTSFCNDDVIMAKITPCMENGKAAITRGLKNGLGFGSTEFHVLRSTCAVIPEFIFHYIRQESFRRVAEGEMTGSVGQKRVPADFMRSSALPIPPLAEQKRIVAKVEALLARVNATRNRLAKVPTLLKRFRQSVLAAACSGRLTADWREQNPDVEPALDTPESEDSDEISETWRTEVIGNLTTLVTSGSRGWAEYYSDTGPLFIRAQDINTDFLVMDYIAHVRPPKGAEGRRTQARKSDILITITGANVTKSALVKLELEEAYVSQHVGLVRLKNQAFAPYVYFWIISPMHGRKELLEAAYGAGKPGLNLENIRVVSVAIPPLDEQREIVRRVEKLFKLADAIEKRVAAATLRAEKLTQAILAKAFRGELVPTEAELARREGREYELASVLLERINLSRTINEPALLRRRGKSSGGVA